MVTAKRVATAYRSRKPVDNLIDSISTQVGWFGASFYSLRDFHGEGDFITYLR